MAVLDAADVACEFDDRCLHSQADAEEWKSRHSCVTDGFDHALDPTDAETAWNQKSVIGRENLGRAIGRSEVVTRQPLDVDTDVVRDAAVDERFLHAFVAIDEVGVLPNDRDAHAIVRLEYAV